MVTHRIGIVMNGVTGRMGTNQHLLRSIVAIREQGGVRLADGGAIVPEPLLVGRNRAKLEAIAARAGGVPWTTDLDQALGDDRYTIYFDAQSTDRRAAAVRRAIAAGRHVYCEKPSAATVAEALELYELARDAGVCHGVVQDKLWLPGIVALRELMESGYFGRLLSVRGEFGYWVFEGDEVAPQRPSWNYRAEEGGGIIADMFAHWRYVLDEVFGRVVAVSCLGATHIPQRWDEQGRPYACTADDAAYATFKLEGGVIAQFNSSWAVRVRRDDLLTIQVDGTKGSAVAGLRRCWAQPAAATPRPVWNPDEDSAHDYRNDWREVPTARAPENAFKAEWELFLRHVVCGDPFPWDLLAGARGVQLAELGYESWKAGRWVEVEELGA
ncbi:MAG TPA: Gfo/Idh/MocA family oxidoreductase [Vicinamibacterales bacterium]|nr:Gfo/Idh/MocA family oxidoreductase [Vicinamibacterales bacterium]